MWMSLAYTVATGDVCYLAVKEGDHARHNRCSFPLVSEQIEEEKDGRPDGRSATDG
jgi:hypothetical protein